MSFTQLLTLQPLCHVAQAGARAPLPAAAAGRPREVQQPRHCTAPTR
jgi:hypothetical protein